MRIQGPSGLPPQIQPQGEHTVQQGDTLASLAQKFGTTPEALAKANNLAPNAALLPGQMMTIPKAGQSAIQQGIASVQDKFEYIKPTATFELPNIALGKQKSAFDKGNEIHVKESGPIWADSSKLNTEDLTQNPALEQKVLKGKINE